MPSGPPYVTTGRTNRQVVALTFDDGPWPDTPQFLDILERDHVPATFFQIGEQVSTYGRSVDRRMLADGDMIGDHTWNHANVSGDGLVRRRRDLATAAAIRRHDRLHALPVPRARRRGQRALIAEARSMGFTTIEWDVDPRDWARPGTGAIYSTWSPTRAPGRDHHPARRRRRPLGDARRAAAGDRHAAGRGYQFVTVTQLLGQRLIYK